MALAVLAFHSVRNGGANNGNLYHVALGVSNALAHGFGNLGSLAKTNADPAFAVADNHQRGEAEVTAALNDLGDAVNVYKPFLEFHFGCIDTLLHLDLLRIPARPCERRRQASERGRCKDNHRGRILPA